MIVTSRARQPVESSDLKFLEPSPAGGPNRRKTVDPSILTLAEGMTRVGVVWENSVTEHVTVNVT